MVYCMYIRNFRVLASKPVYIALQRHTGRLDRTCLHKCKCVGLFYNAIGAVVQYPYKWGVGSAFHRMKIHIYEAKEVRSMKWHVGNKHEGKVYQCNECDHTGSSWHLLKIHQRNKHEGVRFKCPKCDYEVTQKGNLQIHRQAVHDGIVHACSLCNYKASTKRSLNLHRKAKH